MVFSMDYHMVQQTILETLLSKTFASVKVNPTLFSPQTTQDGVSCLFFLPGSHFFLAFSPLLSKRSLLQPRLQPWALDGVACRALQMLFSKHETLSCQFCFYNLPVTMKTKDETHKRQLEFKVSLRTWTFTQPVSCSLLAIQNFTQKWCSKCWNNSILMF